MQKPPPLSLISSGGFIVWSLPCWQTAGITGDYSTFLPCSSWMVSVVISATSAGPKYWIGPGYT